jgi:hypothetical protein
MTAQQEMMKQLVSALGEVERGKQAGLAAFLNEYGARIAGRPSKEDHARVKAEVRSPARRHFAVLSRMLGKGRVALACHYCADRAPCLAGLGRAVFAFVCL